MTINYEYVSNKKGIEKTLENFKNMFSDNLLMSTNTKEEVRVKLSTEVGVISELMLAKRFNENPEDFIKIINLLEERIEVYKKLLKKIK